MPFQKVYLLQAFLVAVVADVLLLWQMPLILSWHTRVVGRLLDIAEVPWSVGRDLAVLPGITGTLIRTDYLSYELHPLYPWVFTGAAVVLFLVSYRFMIPPLRPLLFLIPGGLVVTLFYLKVVSPELPYSPEDFSAIWYRGECYLWLLIPWIFGLGLFTLRVPFRLKLPWLVLVFAYSLLWSAIRLATGLATFYYFGGIWMPMFYFIFGFLADFLYIVAIYSLAMDRAAVFLIKEREVWES